jgi:SAM-dependent methyltransferase
MLRHVFWDIDFLQDKEILRSPQFGMNKESKASRYPIRLLRYWFMYHFLRNERCLKQRPLTVCEVGVDTGQMLRFMRVVECRHKGAAIYGDWIGVDNKVNTRSLIEAGYASFLEKDIETEDLLLPKKYDALILLHVLEHLRDPEKAFKNLLPHVADGGIVIGGMPVMPHFLTSAYEKKLRKKASPGGHVSVFSVDRVKDMARRNGLKVEFVKGAYFRRNRKSPFENFSWWMRFNLTFGALFPSCGNEVYWMVRKVPGSTGF